MTIRVFVSYSSQDRDKAAKLVAALKRERDITVWFDEDEILPGDDMVERMKSGIEAADHIIVCLSPSFEEKPPTSWVRKELRMAMLRESQSQAWYIIPVRLERGGEIPTELGTRAYADLSSKDRWDKNYPRLLKALRKER
jgi:hypothetical protein